LKGKEKKNVVFMKLRLENPEGYKENPGIESAVESDETFVSDFDL